MPDEIYRILKLLRSFWEEVKKAASSVPRGAVATYGDLAEALGDKGAARALPRVLKDLKREGDPFTGEPADIPLHRFVRADGRVREEQMEALEGEGVRISRDGFVTSLRQRLYRSFRAKPILLQLKELQGEIGREMAEGHLQDAEDFLSVDVAYWDGGAVVCGVLFSPGGREELSSEAVPLFPYIPGYLFYREGILIISFVEREGIKPALMILDGHGILHPRGAGLATHVGCLLGIPTLGVAKSLLVGEHRRVEEVEEVYLAGKHKGWAVRKSLIKGRGSRYLYVSPGWGVDLEGSLELYLKAVREIKDEPVEAAHRCAARWKYERTHYRKHRETLPSPG